MKLGIISSMAGASWGGSEELWVGLGLKALSKGDQVAVSVFDWGVLPPKIKHLQEEGASIHLRARISYPESLGKIKGKLVQLFQAEAQLKKFVDVENPDVLFISTGAFCDLEINSLRRFLLSLGLPFYIVVHSNTETSKINSSKIDEVKKVCEKAKSVMFVSEKIKHLSQKQIACKFENSQIVVNPVNINVFGVLPYDYSGPVQMACVGSIQVAVKGQALLLKVLGSKHWAERDWILNIYGRGPDESLLRDLIVKHGLQKKVVMKGYAEDIRKEIWSKNQLLLMPSYFEGMPIALMEAMLCGRTAVVTDVGGNKELIENGVTGYLSDQTNELSFDNALEVAWNDRSNWQRMGELAYKKALNLHGIDPVGTLLEILRTNK